MHCTGQYPMPGIEPNCLNENTYFFALHLLLILRYTQNAAHCRQHCMEIVAGNDVLLAKKMPEITGKLQEGYPPVTPDTTIYNDLHYQNRMLGHPRMPARISLGKGNILGY